MKGKKPSRCRRILRPIGKNPIQSISFIRIINSGSHIVVDGGGIVFVVVVNDGKTKKNQDDDGNGDNNDDDLVES